MTEEPKPELGKSVGKLAVAAGIGLAVDAVLDMSGVGSTGFGPELAQQATNVAEVLGSLPPAFYGTLTGVVAWAGLNLSAPFVRTNAKSEPVAQKMREFGGYTRMPNKDL